jgi:Cu/Ag efflux protein CusF
MSLMRCIVCFGLIAALPLTAGAQQPKTVTKANKVTATVTIQQIDTASRAVTLRNDKGEEDTFVMGPDVTRFNQLKVGDKVSLTYYESLVFEVRKPGTKSNESTDVVASARAKTQPGAGIVAQQTRTVTVKAIDATAPSITVVTADGQTITRKIEDRKNIDGVKVGDRIDITYSQALVIAAEPAKQ